jgi:hypothetical protein
MESQRAFLGDPLACGQYLEQVRLKAIRAIGLPVSSVSGKSERNVRITLPDTLTWSTPDNVQTREALADEVIKILRVTVESNSIAELRSPGIQLDVAPRQGLKYDLFATIYY